MWFWKSAEADFCALFIVSMRPPDYSLSMVASPRCRFRFARQNDCLAPPNLQFQLPDAASGVAYSGRAGRVGSRPTFREGTLRVPEPRVLARSVLSSYCRCGEFHVPNCYVLGCVRNAAAFSPAGILMRSHRQSPY